MAKAGEIIGLILIIIAGIFIFPDQVLTIVKNKFFMMIGAIILLAIIFLIWLRLRTKY
ncbi:MAG: hypothetical protein PF542_05740 [Nanoarchaeota archaeon]|jgi:hypothetical protein|nr:hypothetical protein [Nanoarchaeota archaeon]